MIYPELFLNFLMVGALSFGGGFGMISLIRDVVLSKSTVPAQNITVVEVK